PAVAAQLVKGFSHIEDHAWRWTSREFEFELRAPDPRPSGVLVVMRGTVAQATIDQFGSQVLRCKLGDRALAEEKFTKAGSFVLVREVEALNTATAYIYCTVDHSVRVPGDARELGLIMSTLALLPR